MPTYKLTYFPLKGLGEPIRLLLAYRGEEFEDHRLDVEQWPIIKESMPFGKVPILEVDGEVVYQSAPITRYLAKGAGLTGSNDWEDLQIDMVVDTLHDLRVALIGYWYEPDEAVKAKKKGPIVDETGPYYLEKFNALAKANGGHLANGKLSWADFFFVAMSDFFATVTECNIYEKYDGLRQLRDNVVTIPRIKAWINKRPESMY